MAFGTESGAVRLARDALATPDLRRLQLANVATGLGGWAFMVSLAVHAYAVGGAAAVGLAALVRMVPAGVAAPLTGLAADRFGRREVLLASVLARGVVLVAAALTVALDAPFVLLLVLATLFTIATTAHKPAQAALLPSLAPDSTRQAASSALWTAIDNGAFVAGAVLGGVLVASFGAATAFAAAALAFAAAAAALVQVNRASTFTRQVGTTWVKLRAGPAWDGAVAGGERRVGVDAVARGESRAGAGGEWRAGAGGEWRAGAGGEWRAGGGRRVARGGGRRVARGGGRRVARGGGRRVARGGGRRVARGGGRRVARGGGRRVARGYRRAGAWRAERPRLGDGVRRRRRSAQRGARNPRRARGAPGRCTRPTAAAPRRRAVRVDARRGDGRRARRRHRARARRARRRRGRVAERRVGDRRDRGWGSGTQAARHITSRRVTPARQRPDRRAASRPRRRAARHDRARGTRDPRRRLRAGRGPRASRCSSGSPTTACARGCSGSSRAPTG